MPKIRESVISPGQTFGWLTAIQYIPSKTGSGSWSCKCACGKTCVYPERNLRNRRNRSCGCGRVSMNSALHKEHGLSKHPDFAIWISMNARCSNPNHPRYKDYGGRGITVCERWRESPANFFADMGERPQGYTIERMNNDLGYEPNNCKWISHSLQAQNTRANHFIEHNGESHTLADWGRRLGISHQVISARLILGWTAHEALTIPVSKHNKIKSIR